MAKISIKSEPCKIYLIKINKMTLKCYYENLPRRTQPKDDFLKAVAQRCDVTVTTVRNWILYNRRPQKERYVDILSELSGLKKEELWSD